MQFKVIIRCGPCENYIERSIESLLAQDDQNWQAVVLIDPFGDRTYERALSAAGNDNRFEIVLNSHRLYGVVNLLRGVEVSNPEPEDVVVQLDGDDRFNLHTALSQVRKVYQTRNCWMTYGSWVSENPEWGMWQAYPPGTENFRHTPWRGTSLRTYKYWLWSLIRDEDFRDECGNYLRLPSDLAETFPMLEMCGTHKAAHIPKPLYFFNLMNPASSGRAFRRELVHNALFIRCQKPYPKLDPSQSVQSHQAMIGALDRSGEGDSASITARTLECIVHAIRLLGSQTIHICQLEERLEEIESFIAIDKEKRVTAFQAGMKFLKFYGILAEERGIFKVKMPDRIEYYDVLGMSD